LGRDISFFFVEELVLSFCSNICVCILKDIYKIDYFDVFAFAHVIQIETIRLMVEIASHKG
jgi:hypothetical protein